MLPEIRSDLHLTFAQAGALTAIPVLGFGVASVPGAIFVNRFGARRIVGFAVIALGVAAFLRLVPPAPIPLYAFTAVLSVAIAVAQPGVAVLIRSWFSDRIQQTSTLYAMALAIGALAGTVLTIYFDIIRGWRGTFVIWAVLALLAGLVWMLAAPGRGERHRVAPNGLGRLVRNRVLWHVAALFGGMNLVFYGGLTWIPFLLRSYDPRYLALTLLLFQLIGVPLTAILSTTGRRWADSRTWHAAGALLMTTSCIGFAAGPTSLAWIFAPILGLGTSMVFAGTMALPAILAANSADVAGYSALTVTAGYVVSFAGPLLGGALVDRTGVIASPFWILTAVSVATLFFALTFPERSRL